MSGLLASPRSSLIQAAFVSWQSWYRWKEHANKQQELANWRRERANRQQELRKRLGERLQQLRRDRMREVHDRDQRLRALKEKQQHLHSRSAKLEQRLRNRVQKQQRLMQGKRRLRRRTVRLKHELKSMRASRAWRLLEVLRHIKAKITTLLGKSSS
jgi:flagellar motility protein MotE (MotC chaperone)